MVEVPAVIPPTVPDELTVATPVNVLLHIPPGAASLSDVVPDPQTVAVPVIVPGAGSGLTVTTIVAAAVPQLLVTVYDMIVVPADTPVTVPEELTVAIAVSVLLHAPPGAASLSDVVDSAHTVAVPAMLPATGNAFTVTNVVATAVPQLFVTV
jgi:hypothetical protein